MKSPNSKKMGRPPSENPKSKYLRVRITEEEFANVKEYGVKHDMGQTELVLEAMKKCYPECFNSKG